MHAQLFSEEMDLVLGQGRQQRPLGMCASNEVSDETVRMRSLARALAARRRNLHLITWR